MRLPKMTQAELAVFAACYALETSGRRSIDNSAADDALDAALWSMKCFRQALRERRQ